MGSHGTLIFFGTPKKFTVALTPAPDMFYFATKLKWYEVHRLTD